MNLRFWSSNSSQLKSVAAPCGIDEKNENVKVFDIVHKTMGNKVSFVKKFIPTASRVTKRFILNHIQRRYNVCDPLGMFSPVAEKAKLLMQDLWKEKIGGREGDF